MTLLDCFKPLLEVLSNVITITVNTTKIHMLHPRVKLLIKTRDTKRPQSNDYGISRVFTLSEIISLDHNFQVGIVVLLTSSAMQVL